MLFERWNRSVEQLKVLVATAHKVTVCVDGWSQKNLTCSFLGISACFFDPVARLARHVVLKVVQLPHPHTGENIADCIEQCLAEWGIGSDKVLMIVSDNGSNMLKSHSTDE
jgi:hypothetical protein